MSRYTPHGFVWPGGLPACGLCDQQAGSMIHVTPSPSYQIPHIMAADARMRSHPYILRTGLVSQLRCEQCGDPLNSPSHPIGMPGRQSARDFSADKRKSLAKTGSAMADGSFPIVNAEDLSNAIRLAGKAKDPAAARAHIKKRARALGLSARIPESWGGGAQKAFVAELGGRYVFAAPGYVDETVEDIARQAAEANSANMWIAGRYVQGGSPNRNMAYWTSEDLQFGQPSVDHGPINWLHEEKHIIGTLATSEFVRETAAETSHISVLGAIWPWIAREEARAIKEASDKGNLWFSMECVSREVACLEEGCGHKSEYLPYMRTPELARCAHMKSRGVRRFVDPVFEGAGIIVPPVVPGWDGAQAKVVERLVESQAAAFEGVPDEEAMRVVAALVTSR